MMDPKGKSFSASNLFTEKAIDSKLLAGYAKSLSVKAAEIEANWTRLNTHWPINERGNLRRLKPGHANDWFFQFVNASIQSYPVAILENLRKGSSATTLGGVLMAAYYSRHVTNSFFNVSESDKLLNFMLNSVRQPDAEEFSIRVNQLRSELTELLEKKTKTPKFIWLDQLKPCEGFEELEGSESEAELELEDYIAEGDTRRKNLDHGKKILNAIRYGFASSGALTIKGKLNLELAHRIDAMIDVSLIFLDCSSDLKCDSQNSGDC